MGERATKNVNSYSVVKTYRIWI